MRSETSHNKVVAWIGIEHVVPDSYLHQSFNKSHASDTFPNTTPLDSHSESEYGTASVLRLMGCRSEFGDVQVEKMIQCDLVSIAHCQPSREPARPAGSISADCKSSPKVPRSHVSLSLINATSRPRNTSLSPSYRPDHKMDTLSYIFLAIVIFMIGRVRGSGAI